MVVLGPGSLYTSIIPNLLVDGVVDAIARTKAVRVLVLNIMTQDGETEGYTAADHVRAILAHGTPGMIDVCVGNCAAIPDQVAAAYSKEGAEPLDMTRWELEAMGLELAEYPLAASDSGFARHDPGALATALMEILRKEQKTR
jgi:uncharacterized cofD-like protein